MFIDCKVGLQNHHKSYKNIQIDATYKYRYKSEPEAKEHRD